jgi:hypothetical protein
VDKFLVFVLPLFINSTSISILLPNSSSHEWVFLSQKGSFDLSNTFIGGIKIGISEREAIAKFGAPKSRNTGYNQRTAAYDTTLKYDRLELYFEGDARKKSKRYVSSITTTNSQYSTNRGIRVGDAIKKAERAYSKAAVTGEDGFYLGVNDAARTECSPIFSSRDRQTVSQIELGCATC